MGLDITAYKNTNLVDTVKSIEEWEEKYWMKGKDDTICVWDYTQVSFSDRADGLKVYGVYDFAEEFGFRAGSYSGYNKWREWLCQTVLGVTPSELWNNPDKYQGMPFYELINFSDCEGYIGPSTSAKLAKDFETHQYKADLAIESWYKQQYDNWRKAFEMVAGNGFVKFH